MSEELLQLMGDVGKPTKGLDHGLKEDQLWDLFRWILTMRTIDAKMLIVQRQGRIGFYGPTTGQEAAIIGSVYALSAQDWIYSALREGGAACLMRGMSMDQMLAENFATALSVQKGRQMPCHYAWRGANVVAWSSCIASQLPHATGTAMAMQYQGDTGVVMGYLGDGATSEGDFHVAANFAGVYKSPVVFFCQNNHWAISVPASQQTAAESFAVKAKAYGFPGVRVDGNDILAVYRVTKDAVERARRGEGPTLIEALTYRMGPHSSSDDPSRYRDEKEVEYWRKRDPLERYRAYLKSKGMWTQKKEDDLQAILDRDVASAIERAESSGAPPLESLVEDVYQEVPTHLKRQLQAVEGEARRAQH